MKFYIDTCVWIDFVEGEKYAEEIFASIIHEEHSVLISELISTEFFRYKKYDNIALFITLLKSKDILEHVHTTVDEEREAMLLSKEKDVPKPDALHAILARNNEAILITKDKHFSRLRDICHIQLL